MNPSSFLKGSTSERDDRLMIKHIIEKTGLSEYSLQIYADMTSKTPLKVNTLFRVVCPNSNIKCLSKDELKNLLPIEEQQKTTATSTKKDISTSTSTSTSTSLVLQDEIVKKVVKKSDDEMRKLIVRNREKEIATNGLRVAASNIKKPIPILQKDLQLMYEFLGWGQTSTNYYVFLYYIGPKDKGLNNIELSRHENWHIVPESHLALFHKNIGPRYMSYLQQSIFTVKDAIDGHNHIEYDVRYILYKWKNCTRDLVKEHISLVNENVHLFYFKDSPSITNQKKRKAKEILLQQQNIQQQQYNKTLKKVRLDDISLKGGGGGGIVKKQYEVKNEKYRRVIIDEDKSIHRYPLSSNGLDFNIVDLNEIMKNTWTNKDDDDGNNNDEEEERHPTSYKWEPIKIIKAWMIATSIVRHRKQVLQTIIQKYNLFFENTDFSLLFPVISSNPLIIDDIKRASDSFTWSYVLFRLLLVEGIINKELVKRIESKYNQGGGETTMYQLY